MFCGVCCSFDVSDLTPDTLASAPVPTPLFMFRIINLPPKYIVAYLLVKMEIIVAAFILVVLFCIYLAVINSDGLKQAHQGPIRIGDKGYSEDAPNHQ